MDSETSQGREVGEGLHAHGLGGLQADDTGVTGLDELGSGLSGFTCTTINLLQDLGELAGDMSGVTIQHWRVSVTDLSRVVQHDDLGGEVLHSGGGLVLGVGGNVSSLDILDGDVLDVEPDVVSGESFSERLVVHLHGLDLSGQLDRGEGHEDSRLQDSSLHSPHGHCANASNFINILEGQTQGLVGRSLGRDDRVEALEKGDATGLSFLALDSPALVPGHVGRGFDHVVAMKPGDGHESHSGGVVADLLDEAAHLLLDLLEPRLGVGGLGGVHLVDGHDELLDPEGVGEQGVLPGLTVLGDTGFKLSSSGGNDEDSTISLRGSGDHVLDEITMAGSVDDGYVVLGSLELPESDIDGDSTLTLGLQFVQSPRVLEGALAHLLSFLLELLNGSLVDTSALVDEMTGGGGLTRVHVANHHDVDMDLFLSHGADLG